MRNLVLVESPSLEATIYHIFASYREFSPQAVDERSRVWCENVRSLEAKRAEKRETER